MKHVCVNVTCRRDILFCMLVCLIKNPELCYVYGSTFHQKIYGHFVLHMLDNIVLYLLTFSKLTEEVVEKSQTLY